MDFLGSASKERRLRVYEAVSRMAKKEDDRELVEGLVKGLEVIASFDEDSPEIH